MAVDVAFVIFQLSEVAMLTFECLHSYYFVKTLVEPSRHLALVNYAIFPYNEHKNSTMKIASKDITDICITLSNWFIQLQLTGIYNDHRL